jgi:RNA polymerase sigma factor (sigma-70 family)
LSDEDLLIRAKAGDDPAIELLAQIAFLKVLPVLIVKFGKPELLPLLEDGVIVALQKFLNDNSVRASTIRSFKSWIKTTASNHVLDMLKKTRKDTSSLYVNEFNEIVEIEFDAEVYVEEDVVKDVFLQHLVPLLEEAMSKLDPRDKLIIKRYYYNNADLVSISNETGLSVANVKQRKKRALEKLRPIMLENGIRKEDVL